MQAERSSVIPLSLMFTRGGSADLTEMKNIGLLCTAAARVGKRALSGPNRFNHSISSLVCEHLFKLSKFVAQLPYLLL